MYFLSKVEKTESCWEWKGTINRRGYGRMRHKGVNTHAHRVSYKLYRGEIPRDMLVCHKCDNPSCVNPEHLFIGSHKDNMEDRQTKQRQAKGEKIGLSKLTNEQVRKIRVDNRSTRKIARDYGVHHSQIARIKTHEAWAHVK
jgi:hypothetical protein